MSHIKLFVSLPPRVRSAVRIALLAGSLASCVTTDSRPGRAYPSRVALGTSSLAIGETSRGQPSAKAIDSQGFPVAPPAGPPIPASSAAGTNLVRSGSCLPHSALANPVVQFNGQRYEFDGRARRELLDFQRALGVGRDAVALVGLVTTPGPALKKRAAAHGVDLLAYVPDHAWCARVHGSGQPAELADVGFFKPFDAALRIQPGLRSVPPSAAEVPVYVHAVRDRHARRVLPALQAAGFDQLTVQTVGDDSYLAGTIVANRLAEFLAVASAQPEVQAIERGGRARLLNEDAARTTQSGWFLGPTPFFEHGILGSNQLIAVCDTGLDVDSCYFRDDTGALPPINRIECTQVNRALRKVVAADFLFSGDDPANPLDWDNHGHGTAVAGCATGSSRYAPFDVSANNGMAPAAQLIIQDAGFAGADACADLLGLGCPITNFYPTLLQAVAQGAVIHNNSWGDQEDAVTQNLYTEVCRELDLVTWSNKQLLVVCAAGNNALSNTVGSPSVAKNCLSVAATMSGSNQEKIAGFSSRGWASDGRFKPDLAVPGANLSTAGNDADITTDNCFLTSQSGTSFASPIVAGLAALVRDYFAQGFYPTGAAVPADRRPDVSAALVKAALINTAVHMSNATAFPPARDQGWGRVNLAHTLKLTNDTRALFVVDQPAGFVEVPDFPFLAYLRLRSTNQALKVTLVWTDYPSTPGAEQHLVNDLDLRVRTPAMTLKGNVLTHGQSVPGGEYDRLNNVEQVHWSPSATAIVEIAVWAHRIVAGPQDFALVATGDIEPIPATLDADDDGLPDYWELWHFGSLAATPAGDPDLDTASNLAEFEANTNPLDPASVATLTTGPVTNGTFVLSMPVSEGRRYTLEAATGLSAPMPWSEAAEGWLIGEPIGELLHDFTDTVLTNAMAPATRFYRVRIDRPPH